MPTISLKKTDVPFLLGGAGEIAVDSGDLSLTKRIPEDTPSILSAGFKAAGDEQIALGQADTVKLGVSTAARVDMTPIFASSGGAAAKLLNTYGIGGFFAKGAHADQVVLCFDAGASADAAVGGAFTYGALKASAQLDAGADAGYAYLRAFDKEATLGAILPAFFKTMRLPEQVSRVPERGEAIALQYGGYLKLSAELAAGYRLAGTQSFAVGKLALSEKYDLSILGKVGLSADVAGRFAILITADDVDGWARVQVRRQRSKSLKIAADVNVGFKPELDGLPPTAHEFLGAALGVNAKNFLTIFEKAQLSTFDEFRGAIDGLARKYVEEFIGKGFDSLKGSSAFKAFLGRVTKAIDSYDSLGDRAATLFDRYFDRLTELTTFLDKVQGLSDQGLEALRGELNPESWRMLSQLTDGDPLGFLLGRVPIAGKKVNSLPELKKRAADALELIRGAAHEELRRVIALASESFGIDKLFAAMAKIDTADELQALANEKVGLFVTRLVGRTLDSSTNVKEAFKEVQAVLAQIDTFSEKLFKAFKEATSSSYKMALHAEYSRASEADALVDVAINMSDARGARLLALAGKGDFEQIVAASDTGVLRLHEGVLTHRIRRDSAFNVNIVGWHLNYQYSGFDRVITDTEQRLIPSDQGITVLTTTTLALERERKRRDEAIHVNFLLRALGESAKVVKSDKDTFGYLIDTLNSLSARYQLAFTDDDTSAMELNDYLAFARELGLDAKGAALADLVPLLPRAANGGFGRIDSSYDVRFGESALQALLSLSTLSKPAAGAIRSAMRMMVLSNYLKSDEQHDVAFAYATPSTFDTFDEEGFATFTNASERIFPVRVPNVAIAAPSAVNLNRMERRVLATLYNIENSMVKAIADLIKLLNGPAMSPERFEKALGKFGDALKQFDDFDQTTSAHGVGTSTVFAMFDALVRLAAPGGSANTAVLRLGSRVNGKEVEKLFLTDAAARAR
jgi:hypothetical protein